LWIQKEESSQHYIFVMKENNDGSIEPAGKLRTPAPTIPFTRLKMALDMVDFVVPSLLVTGAASTLITGETEDDVVSLPIEGVWTRFVGTVFLTTL
jgi:hypothetical protein